MKIGVLAVQGDYQAHADALARAGAEAVLVKHASQVAAVDGVILPGGESTTCLKFLAHNGLGETLRQAALQGKPMLGTCAGAILMARRVEDPAQESLGLLDVTVRRNAYGRQISSFIAPGEFLGLEIEMVFIRAPQFIHLGGGVEVLGRCRGLPVLVRQGNLLAGAFHPELTADPTVHRYFVDLVRVACASAAESHSRP